MVVRRRRNIYLDFYLICVIFAILWAGVFFSGAAGQTKPPETNPPVSASDIKSRLEKVEKNPALAADVKKQVQTLYEQSLQHLEQAKQHQSETADFEQQIASAPQQLDALKATLAKTDPKPQPIPADLSLSDLEQRVIEAEVRLLQMKKEFAQSESEPHERRLRQKQLLVRQESLLQEIAKLSKELAEPPPKDEEPALTFARKTLEKNKLHEARSEFARNQKELKLIAATQDLLPLQSDWNARQVSLQQQRVDRLREEILQRDQRASEREIENAKKDIVSVHPALASVARKNLQLAKQSRDLVQTLDEVTDELKKVEADYERLQKQDKETRQKIEKIGLTETLGLLLRKQRAALPSIRHWRRQWRSRKAELRKAHLRTFDLDAERAQLAMMDQRVEQFLASLPSLPKDVSKEKLRESARDLFEKRKAHLTSILRHQKNYTDKLGELIQVESRLISETESYSQFIDERVLWIRSAVYIRWSDFARAGEAAMWLFSPVNWWQSIQALAYDAAAHPVLYLIAVALIVGLVVSRKRFKSELSQTGQSAIRGICQSYWPTATAFGITLLLASLGPLILFFLSWRLAFSAEPTPFTLALAYGLAKTAELALYLEFLRVLCVPDGLAESHFRWRKQTRLILRRNLAWYAILSLPMVFIFTALQYQPNEAWQSSLGRFACVLFLILFAVFAHRVLRPDGPIIHGYGQTHSHSWPYRLRHFTYAAGVFVPLAVAVLAVVGYYFTAYQLVFRLRSSVWFLAGLVIVECLLMRWLVVNHRRLAIRQALEKRDAKYRKESTKSDESDVPETPPPEINLTSISEQSKQLVRIGLFFVVCIGLWLIWTDVLPALRILQNITIWEITADGQTEAITLWNIAVAVLIFSVTLLAVKNIPGLLELTLLPRLSLDSGANYAVLSLLRYGLFITGTIITFNTIGIRWSQYQWIVAAATVGLGFGLQEIFANFVSGLILLTERPIRIGDLVTVGDVSGVVTKISLRATIITNWDRKEYVVPNKDFITGRVLNWTLSHTVNRVVINVSVPSTADADQVKELLLSVAHNHRHIMKDPTPMAFLDTFGNGSMTLSLLCYLPNFDHRIPTMHEMQAEILSRLQQAGIEIAKPEQAIHIRTMPPTTADWRRDQASAGVGEGK